MFCIKCGVELTDGQSICPVCGTRVYHPDVPIKQAPPTYPKKDLNPRNSTARAFCLS